MYGITVPRLLDTLGEKHILIARSCRVMKLEALQSIYDPEVKNALRAYEDHLAQVRARLKARERSAKENLAQYEEVGRSMGAIANRYVELVQEVENVKAQIRRLDDNMY